MPDDAKEFAASARLAHSIAEVAPQAWNALANPPGQPANPFVSHAFLSAIEDSGSTGEGTGWSPRHLLVERDGRLVGAAPMYLKSHSYGEYVFDHAWADAYERAGGRYYPKLLIAAPFTPAPGPRLLAASEDDRLLVAGAAAQVAAQSGASSLHVNFARESDWRALGELGFLQRVDQQFHWENTGDWRTFDDFLAALASRKRKTLRKERAAALESGVRIDWITGPDIREAHWDHFWDFYQDTGARKWGRPYLTREFFSLLGERMADRALLVFAMRGDTPVAGALNIIGDDTLFGRYWGCTEDIPFLHFEVCYYQAIDFALARGLKRVEAGAQGEHKLARGYAPRPTYSAHWIADPGFRDAVARYLEAERRHVGADIDALAAMGPFRKGG